MKPLIVNTYTIGGAATAAYRLHFGLLEAGVESKFVHAYGPNRIEKDIQIFPEISFSHKVSSKLKSKINALFRDLWLSDEEVIMNKRPKNYDFFSLPYSDFRITKHHSYIESDLVNLHWIAKFIDYKSFFSSNNKPTFWTLHDMNPFTGGCHYTDNCVQFKNKCISCPQLEGTKRENDIRQYWGDKYEAIQTSDNLKFICLSKWMQDTLNNSTIGSSKESCIIRNGIDENLFQPYPKDLAKMIFDFPTDKIVILFVSQEIHNKRKGFSVLKDAIDQINNKSDFHFVAVGGGVDNSEHIQYIQHINDQRLMPLLYSAADTYVIPSLLDNMPNTIAEAHLCGLPVIGFKNSGVKEMINHDVNGLLVDTNNAFRLAKAIEKLPSKINLFSKEKIREQAVKDYSIKRQVEEYIQLFKSK